MLSLQQQRLDDQHPWNADKSQDEQHDLNVFLTGVESRYIFWLSRVVHQEHVDEVCGEKIHSHMDTDARNLDAFSQGTKM